MGNGAKGPRPFNPNGRAAGRRSANMSFRVYKIEKLGGKKVNEREYKIR